MKIALLNNVSRIWAIGKYAYELHKELAKKIPVDHLYFDYERKELRTENKKQVIAKDNSIINNKMLFLMRMQKCLPEYDIFHAANQNISFMIRNKKSVVTCHDIYPYIKPKNFLERQIRKFAYSGLQKADFVIADSENTKKDLVKHFGISEDKIKVIYLAAGKEFRKTDKSKARRVLKLSKNAKILLNIGEDIERKNTERIYKAYYEARKKNSQLMLIRVGKANRKLADVKYYENISDKEMVLLYNAADILLIPSIYEGFGLPVLEAFACGTAVIASNTSSLPEVVGDAGLFVDPYKTEEISNAISELSGNEKLRSELVKKGLKRAKRFTWQKCANEVLKVYRELEKK
ncbi:MAG: glycosyltransferase family 1 protein [Nanoarchaeota archaeon]